jgi:hypothetical protein
VTRERTPERASQDQLREFRRIVAAAIGELRSQEVRDSFSSLSLEELADQHIERLEESADPLHPSRLQRLRKVRDDLAESIEAMKETPPSRFRRYDPDNDANTPPGTED